MAKIAVLGAGISGHTAALELRRKLPREHEVIVVSPDPRYNWIPSNIWVGVGIMSPEEVTFELEPVYERLGIRFHQGRAVELHPEGGAEGSSPHVIYESTEESRRGIRGRIDCDFIVNATGPKFNYAATPGLGPDQGHTHSVCTDAVDPVLPHLRALAVGAIRRRQRPHADHAGQVAPASASVRRGSRRGGSPLPIDLFAVAP